MNRVYDLIFRLQDMLSPQMLHMASTYDRVVTGMERKKSAVSGMFSQVSQTVSRLRQNLFGLFGMRGRLKVDSSEVDGAERKVSRLRDSFSRFMKGTGQSAVIGGFLGGAMGGMVTEAANLIQNQIGLMKEKTIGAAQNSQSTVFSLTELMGKAGTAGLIRDIDKYAPERREQLIGGAKMLSGAGVASDQLMPALKALNNISAITNQSVDELAMIQAKIKATGYVQGDEINMFKERGINLNPFIAQVMKVNENQIAKLQSKGAITYDIFNQAMQAYAGTGGRFDGAYERKQAGTVEGREQATFGKLDAILRGWGDKLLPIKSMFLDMFGEVLNGTGPVVAIFDKLWQIVLPVKDGIVGLLQTLGILNEQGAVSQGVMDALTFAWEYFGKVVQVVGYAVGLVAQVIGWLIDSKLSVLLIGMYALIKAWGLLNLVMAMNPFALVVIGLTAVVAGIMYAWDKFDGFREGILKTWEVIKTVFSNIGSFLKAILTGDIKGVIAIVGRVVADSSKNANAAVKADRITRAHAEKQAKLQSMPKPGVVVPGAGGGGGLASNTGLSNKSGLDSAVGNSKSSVININIQSLIGHSEVTVMDLQEGVDNIESTLVDMLLRVVNSGTRIATS